MKNPIDHATYHIMRRNTMKEINKAAYHIIHCIDNIAYARTYLQEVDQSGVCSPDIRDRIDELDAILSDLHGFQDYLENTDFTS